MKLTVLVDNTCLGKNMRAEHGFACHIWDGSHSVLFDTGSSDLLVQNAAALGIDLGGVDAVALSHGHWDHTGGLPALLDIPRKEGKAPLRLVCHPAAVEVKERDGKNMGCPMTKEELADRCSMELSAEPQTVSPNLTLLGRVHRTTAFEHTEPMGRRRSNGVWLPDGLPDDTALCCKTVKGIFVITGCAHSGICNVIQQVRSVFPGQQIAGVLGGFHLRSANEQSRATAAWLREQNIPLWYPCHCTCLEAKCQLHAAGLNVHEVGVGTVIEL